MDVLLADVSTVIFSMVTLVPLLLERNRQVFQPMKFYAGLQVLLVLPASLLLVHNPEFLHEAVRNALQFGVPHALTVTLLTYTLLNASTYVAYYAVIGQARWRTKTVHSKIYRTATDSLWIVAGLIGMGLVLFVYKIGFSGGLEFTLNNLLRRVELQAGLGYLNMILDAAFLVANAIAVRRVAIRGRGLDLLILIGVFALTALIFSQFGGRKSTMQMGLSLLMMYSLFKPDFMPLNVRSIISLLVIYAAFIFYYFIVLLYRNSNELDSFISVLPGIVNSALASFTELLMALSYLDTYIFIVNYFDPSNFYYGSTFIDLLTAPLPSILVPDKPAVDDGMFVRAATLGYRLEPGTPGATLDHNSWPPETLGVAFMNGGVILVPVLGALLGITLGKVYLHATRRINSLFWVIILVHMFLNFEISNLRIVNALSTVLGLIIVLAVVRFLGWLFPLRFRLVYRKMVRRR